MSESQLDEFKTRQRALWAAGEYEALSPFITDVGELVVARRGGTIVPGHRQARSVMSSSWRAFRSW
jgi:hypothetical protein